MQQTPNQIDEIFRHFSQSNPTPETELRFHSPFTLLVAVVLSAQATDKGVNKATETLFSGYDTPEKILALGEEGLRTYIKTIGLYRTKAKNIIGLCTILVEQYNGRVPETREELETLPGVGRKTANVVLNVAFGQPTMAVDTHIFRVSNRLKLAPGRTPRAVENKLLQCIPPQWRIHAHHWLILHGRYTCTARAPKCQVCVLKDLCPSYGAF